MTKLIKVILIFVFLLVLGIGFSILSSEKGEWACEDGQWVKSGNPKGEPPAFGCLKKEKLIPGEPVLEEKIGTPLEQLEMPGVGDWDLYPAGFQEASPPAAGSGQVFP
jgi:hypothetical protein